MKNTITYLVVLVSFFSFSQEKERAQTLALKKANDLVHQANQLINENKFISAEMEYRKAISEQPENVAGTYNLGNSYYRKGNFDEALYRQQQAAKNAVSKEDKHKAFHNIGNILMQNKQCKEAVEAYKNALRNDPTDDESRYNLVLAKECAEQQKDENKDDQNKEEDKKDQDEKEDQQDQKDNKDQGDENKGDENKDQADQKKEEKPKEDQGKEDKQQQPRPQQLSPQQIKNLLEAMNNQEQKTQEKMNAEKQKGTPVKTAKDW